MDYQFNKIAVMLVTLTFLATGCTSYTGIAKSNDALYIIGRTSNHEWIKKCWETDDGNLPYATISCTELIIKPLQTTRSLDDIKKVVLVHRSEIGSCYSDVNFTNSIKPVAQLVILRTGKVDKAAFSPPTIANGLPGSCLSNIFASMQFGMIEGSSVDATVILPAVSDGRGTE